MASEMDKFLETHTVSLGNVLGAGVKNVGGFNIKEKLKQLLKKKNTKSLLRCTVGCQDYVGQSIFLKLLAKKKGGSQCHHLRDEPTCHSPHDKKNSFG